MKLLVMCSTKRRPKELKRMLVSFCRTRTRKLTKLVVYISEEDPHLEEYKKIISQFSSLFLNIQFIIDKERSLVEILNYLSTELYPDMQYYGEINDDHIYRTNEWDRKLIWEIETKGGGWGIACPNDLVCESRDEKWNKKKHPSGFVMSGNIVRTLGYFTYPKLRHFHSDEFHSAIGLGIDRLFHKKNVIIEHACWNAIRKGPEDENVREIYSKESMDHGIKVIKEWKKFQMKKDIQKLKEAMKDES